MPASRATHIEIVLASHLHFDHAGGFTARDASGAIVPAFPTRPLRRPRPAEWDDATHPHERNRASYLQENFVPLADAASSISWPATPRSCRASACRGLAATRGSHQMVVIESGGQTAVFAADLIPTVAHVDEPWIMGYDLYPMETLAFKRAFVREAIDREYLIFFEHDPEIAAGYIREKDGRTYVEPVA